MKVCASCGASLPDGAAFCIGCGSKEFRSESMPDLNAPQEEKPKIEYDQYGRPIGQQYAQSQYEEPRFAVGYDDYNDNSSSSLQSDYPQYIEQYSEQMSQYGQSGYSQQQYDQSGYTQQYDNSGYGQQYDDQPQYDNSGYGQQYDDQPQYDSSGYGQQYDDQPQYDNTGYEQQYEQPQYSEQQYEEPQPVEDEKPAQNFYHSEHTSYDQIPTDESSVSDIDPYAYAAEEKKKVDPHEAAKNFKFEKSESDPKPEEQPEEQPKSVKGWLAKFQDTKDYTVEYDPNKLAENKQYCKLAVLGITFWVPFVAAKDCGSARFYANQGLLIFIVELILLIPELIFTGIIGVGLTLGAQIVVGLILDLIITAVIYSVPIFMIVTAFKNIDNGKVKDIPFIGRFRILK